MTGNTTHLRAMRVGGELEATAVSGPKAVEVIERDGAVHLLHSQTLSHCVAPARNLPLNTDWFGRLEPAHRRPFLPKARMPLLRPHSLIATHRPHASTELSFAGGADAAALLRQAGEIGRHHPRPGTVFHQTDLLLEVLTATPQALVAAFTRDGTVRTLWPLRIERRYGALVATDLASPLAQYSDVIGEPLDDDSFEALCRQLQASHRVDAILCRAVRADSGLTSVLSAMPNAGIDCDGAPFVDLLAFDGFEAYCAQFSKHTARMRRQRRRKLEEACGPLSFTVLSGRAGQAALATALQWKQQWLREQALSSRVIGAEDHEATLIAAANGPGVHVSVLEAGAAPVAIELGFANRHHYAAFMGAFDPALAAFSPGQEQMMLTLAWCFEQGFLRYDLLPPCDAYKLQWTRGRGEEPVQDFCVGLTAMGTLYKIARQHARARLKHAVLALPKDIRAKALRYGPLVAGAGATAATIGVLTDW
ncbi:GNAT family N-acetyltransferase [Leptospira sp. severe_002]|uniref:GNAT family N-acetyltransferase n=1 Tax=Leptospira sp. severe_002 TaxID=2838237 RepID=UPI001E37EE16|nr:GNAT family N-acetyltransferase [Leptospira sp. severe_002]